MYLVPQSVDFVIRRIMNKGGEAYIVGGAVRDLILERPVNDWDIATSFTPDEIEILFSDMHTIPTGKKFGTVTIIVDNMPIQVTTFRGEGQYTDYRHPDRIIFVPDIESDLSRRDFTINAMAFNPYHQPAILDPMGGLMDINKKLVRAVGIPSDRFAEDPLRMMRAARFLSQLGFVMETETRNAIEKQSSLILKVSSERIRDELDKLLLGNLPYKGLSFLFDVGIFNLIFAPSASKTTNLRNSSFLKMIDFYPSDIILRLAAVFNFAVIPNYIVNHDIILQSIQEVLHRLRYDKQTITHTSRVVSNLRNTTFNHEISNLTYQVKKLISEIGEDDTSRIIFIKEKEMSILGQKMPFDIHRIFKQILERKEPIYLSDLAINGHDLINSGIGKNNPEIVGKLLKLAQDWVLKCPQRNVRSYLLPRLQSIIPYEEDKT